MVTRPAVDPAATVAVATMTGVAPGSQYQMLQVIGRGSYGTVWLAQDTTTNQHVAIKAIKRQTLLTPESQSQLRREITALAAIRHQNVVAFRECYEDNAHVYIVTELCGQELYDHIVENEFIPEHKTKKICYQILHAVQHLHSKGMVHRDIKPENFCLCGENKDVVKLIDFGLCCVHRNEVMGNRCGSYFYVAPEVLHKSYRGGSCDVWSVGVVLFVMLVGYPPFYGETDAEIAEQVMNAEVDLTQARWTNISDEAKDLITRLLNKNPNQRINVTEALSHPWLREMHREYTKTSLPVPSLLECTKRRRSKSLELRGTDYEEPAPKTPPDARMPSQTCGEQELHTLEGAINSLDLCADPANAPRITPQPPKQPRPDKMKDKLVIFRRSFRRKANSVACAP